MIRVVIDANTLVSGFAGARNSGSIPGHLIRRWSDGRYTLVVSEHLRTEVLRTFQQPYFRRRISPAQISRAAALLRFEAATTLITVEVAEVATHPEDDLTLATALSAEVTYLVSGDKKRQELRAYSGIAIASPREFAEILAERPA